MAVARLSSSFLRDIILHTLCYYSFCARLRLLHEPRAGVRFEKCALR